MSIPDQWRGIFDPKSERTPFWTLHSADLRGRLDGREARLVREHSPGKADFLHVSVTCRVPGLFRMTRPGGIVPSMPLSSTFQLIPVGEAELDASWRFWSDAPDRMVLMIQQSGVKQALTQLGAPEKDFLFVTIRSREAEAVYSQASRWESDKLRVVFSALGRLATAAERAWADSGPGSEGR